MLMMSPALLRQARRGRLREKQRSLQRLLPIRSSHCGSVICPTGVGIKARGVVDQNIEAPKLQQRGSHQLLRRLRVSKFAA